MTAPASPGIDPGLSGALLRYRIAAWVVGVFLIVLMFIAVPLRWLAGIPEVSAVVSPIHGFGYMVYIVLAFDLARRANWALWPRMVTLLIAGTIPIMSFVAEKWAVRLITEQQRAAAESPSASVTAG